MSPYAVVHQRYSTNTLPTWHLAHPFRIAAHNGEINTLRGNINRMRAREANLSSPLFGNDIAKLRPIINEAGSDSAIFDNVLELLVMSGRSLPHAVMMMIPEDRGVDRHLAPPEDRAPFRGGDPFEGPGAPFGKRLVHGEKEHPRGVLAARRKVEPVSRAHLAEEGVGDLEEEAGAVAGRLVAPQGAAVLQVDEDPDPLLDHGVQGNAVDPGNEPDAAAVVVVPRIVQAGRFRDARGVQPE